jgi:hypothetical protein
MKRTTTTILWFALCAVAAVLSSRPAWACQVDAFYLTKADVLAASTPEQVNAAAGYEQAGNKERVADLVKSGAVLLLAENIKVQVLERSFESKTLKIRLPGRDDAFWVRDGMLKPIESK